MELSIPAENFYLELDEDGPLDTETAEESLEPLKYQKNKGYQPLTFRTKILNHAINQLMVLDSCIPACPLIQAACKGDHLSTVSVLIRSGKARSKTSQTSRFPLYAAVI